MVDRDTQARAFIREIVDGGFNVYWMDGKVQYSAAVDPGPQTVRGAEAIHEHHATVTAYIAGIIAALSPLDERSVVYFGRVTPTPDAA